MAFDLSSTTPAAPTGRHNLPWQSDGSANISFSDSNGPAEILTTKGDLQGYDSAPDRVPVGTNGQVLTADSTQALGLKWSTPGSSALTTKGDLLGYDTAPDRVPVGSNGQVLTADSTQALGVKWATPATGIQKYTTSWTLQTSVTVTHNLGTTAVIVQVYDTSGASPVLAIPESVTVTSSNVITLTFGAAFTGFVVVIG